MINKEATKSEVYQPAMIHTTLGDLICAIADAAKEACVDDAELARLTKHILDGMLKQYQS